MQKLYVHIITLKVDDGTSQLMEVFSDEIRAYNSFDDAPTVYGADFLGSQIHTTFVCDEKGNPEKLSHVSARLFGLG